MSYYQFLCHRRASYTRKACVHDAKVSSHGYRHMSTVWQCAKTSGCFSWRGRKTFTPKSKQLRARWWICLPRSAFHGHDLSSMFVWLCGLRRWLLVNVMFFPLVDLFGQVWKIDCNRRIGDRFRLGINIRSVCLDIARAAFERHSVSMSEIVRRKLLEKWKSS